MISIAIDVIRPSPADIALRENLEDEDFSDKDPRRFNFRRAWSTGDDDVVAATDAGNWAPPSSGRSYGAMQTGAATISSGSSVRWTLSTSSAPDVVRCRSRDDRGSLGATRRRRDDGGGGGAGGRGGGCLILALLRVGQYTLHWPMSHIGLSAQWDAVHARGISR